MTTQRRFDSLLVTSGRRTTARILSMALGMGATWLAAPSAALAAPVPVTGLHATGVDDTGALLPTGAIDGHWTVTTDDPAFPDPKPIVFDDTKYPIVGAWVDNTATGRWLALNATSAIITPNKTLTFETKIDLTGYVANTTVLDFKLAADDNFTISVNGTDTGIAQNGAYGFQNAVTVPATAAWQAGLNTLTIIVTNTGGGPSGMFADTLVATAEPDLADPDNDGLSNYIEHVGGTDPSKADTDGDGFNDGFEIKWGGNPLDPSDAADMADGDGDGLPNKYEGTIGTDPTKADSDGDGLSDSEEVGADIAHPLNTDGDAKINALDDDDDGDTILTKDEIADATAAHVSDDVDGDGKKNWLDDDADGDGATDGVEGRGDSKGNGIPDYLDATTVNTGDAGAGDGGVTDGGVTDGGATDGGATDGGATDGGTKADGGDTTDTDSGAPDDGDTDGGTTTTSGSSSAGELSGGGISCALSAGSGGGAGGAMLLAFGAIAGALGLRRRRK